MTATPAEPHSLICDTAVLHRAATEVAAKFDGVFSPETVERYVFESSGMSGIRPDGAKRGVTWAKPAGLER